MEPLDPELRRIIREGLAEAAPSADVEARVLAGVLAKLPPGGGAGGDSGPPGGEVVGGVKGAIGGVKGLVIGSVLAVAGVATVATVVADRGGPGPEMRRSEGGAAKNVDVPRDRSVAERDAGAVEAQAGDGAERREEAAGRSGAGRGRRGEKSGAPGREEAGGGDAGQDGVDALLAESRGVAEAEAALGRGDFAGALARVRALEARHPAGQLRLEREAVEVCARCGLNEVGAGEAAREFLQRHAGAAVAGKVRARCAGVPGAEE